MFALIACLAMPADRLAVDSADGPIASDLDRLGRVGSTLFDPVRARAEHFSPGEARTLSKKEEWLREKTLRPDVHLREVDLARAKAKPPAQGTRARARARKLKEREVAAGIEPAVRPGARTEPVTTLFNVWTREALPILPGQSRSIEGRFQLFLRDHFTNQATRMDTRLIGVLTSVAGKFSARRIDVVSGYRSPKYNLMLRKKGRQVARHSQHMDGHAVDFRIKGVATPKILHYVRSLRVGGVGFYPHSQFVHSDTGPIRYWKGS